MSDPAYSTVPFTKASACGNDFLIIHSRYAPENISDFTRRICDRRHGVGADGVEWIATIETGGADVEARLINSDGSEAEISGNGTRCVAAYWLKQYKAETVRVLTGAGVKECRLVAAHQGLSEFEMKLGKPAVGAGLELRLSQTVKGLKVDMGNPQFVVFVSDFDFPWQALGAEVQAQREFPEGVNVDFVRVLDAHNLESRFFERGAGETRSSGTGSCACAVAAIALGKVTSPVTVMAQGGSQQVRWDGPGAEIYLQGPAQLICHGEYFV